MAGQVAEGRIISRGKVSGVEEVEKRPMTRREEVQQVVKQEETGQVVRRALE